MRLFPYLRGLAATAIGCLLALSQAQAQAQAQGADLLPS